jgi:hypothetical protein
VLPTPHRLQKMALLDVLGCVLFTYIIDKFWAHIQNFHNEAVLLKAILAYSELSYRSLKLW